MLKKVWPRRRVFQATAALAASALAVKWLVDEFRPEPSAEVNVVPDGTAGFIDVRQLKKSMSTEELIKTAEEYYASAKNWDFFLTKPFANIEDAPGSLVSVAHLLKGLQLLPGMSVLDFGAASCWLSRWLTQLGMQVIALDVSPTALKMGEAIYQRLPIIGERPVPRFLLFDGHRIELADASLDRILCLDTLHHVPNPDEVLREMGRVLKPGGIAGFSEPGANHSRSPGAQAEMRNFRVLEDDVDIHRIWSVASAAGFARIRLAVLNSQPFLVPLPEFDDYLKGGEPNQRFADATRNEMQERRMFFLQKPPLTAPYDSRSRAGLSAKLAVTVASTSVNAGGSLTATVVATNSGLATWLRHGHTGTRGAVLLGCHLLDASGRRLTSGFFMHPLTEGDGRSIAPGETVTLEVRVPAPPKGSYILEFDLVSQSVAWFGTLGSQPVRIKVQVT